MVALEPDFHFKPTVELYNLIADPQELTNLADREPAIVATLKDRMHAWIARRERETGRANPMFTNLQWHASEHVGPFATSQQAYDTLHIGSVRAADRLQSKSRRGTSAAKRKPARSKSKK